MPPRATAYEDIFGGGSDLSDIEDDDQQASVGDVSVEEPESDDEGRAEAAEEEEREALATEGERDLDDISRDADYRVAIQDAGRLPSFRKDPTQKRRAGTDGEDRPKKRFKKKLQRPDDLESDGRPPRMPLDPVAERAARLDAILQNKKKKVPRKRKGEEDLDELADEEVYRLRQLMDAAAENDKEAVEDGRPAIEKLKLLPEVVGILQKGHLETTILEADILTQMRRWLEPIGKAMPALNIQRALLEALLKMDIETSQLKASELGKVVLFYTKHTKLDPSIKRAADQLVMGWMRPIVRRSAQLRDRNIQRAENATPVRSKPRSRLLPAAARDKTELSRRHAAIPQALSRAYTVAPLSRINVDVNTAPKNDSRFKGMKARLDASRQESKRM